MDDRYKEGYNQANRDWEKKIQNKIKTIIKQANFRTVDNPKGRVHFAPEPEDYQIMILQDLLKKG